MEKQNTQITLRISVSDLEKIDLGASKENRSRANFMITASLERVAEYEN